MAQERVDLIVAGCGPAGASCAGRAAELGLSVVVLEMTEFPRSKPCAAGLTQPALRLLGDDAHLVTHETATRLRMEVGRTVLTWTSDAPLIRTTTRRELDSLLARRAEEAGARIDFGTRADAVRESDTGVSVDAGGKTLTARFLVGADGPRSRIADLVSGPRRPLCGAAYVKVYPSSSAALGRHANTVIFDPTAADRGYGWIFPKRDHLNVGVFSQLPLGSWILDCLRSFVESRGFGAWRTTGPYAASIPARARTGGFARGRLLLAGDAAGLADPISGEGIPHAIASGRMAAEAVASSLGGFGDPAGNASSLGGFGDPAGNASSPGGFGGAAAAYASRVRLELLPDLSSARCVGNVLYSLGPRGIERVTAVPFARFILRRLGWWKKSRGQGGSLTVEHTKSHRHQ